MRTFGCHVTILNTIDHLGKFDGKADEGFFVSTQSIVKQLESNQHRTRDREREPAMSIDDQEKDASVNITNNVNASSTNEVNAVGRKSRIELLDEPNMPALEDIVYSDNDKDVGVEADMNNLDAFMPISPIPTTRVHKDHPTASTPMETQKLLLKDEDGEEVDVHLYRSMIGSLMYLTSSRPDIMFVMYACVRYQVNPKVSHLHVVKRIFSDYAGASLDRKSTTGGCQFLGCRLISWQCKKQTMVANSTTEAEYVAASSCCGQFADTYNLVAFLSKPTESEGFEQIVDFLNANPIRYALTINPTIYTSCIEQFLATAKVKTVNGEVQLQALVDGKKIIVTETSVRRDLQLNDEEGTDCLPNATIFYELTRIGYEKLSQKLTFYKALFSPQWKFLIHTILQCLSAKTTAWNEFSSTMASKQLEGMSNPKRIYVTPSHTKKIFRNMRRVGKGFSRRDTPLFPTMMVQAPQEQGEGLAMPTDLQHTPTIIQPSTSQPQKKQRSRRPKRKETEVPQPSGPTTNVADETVNEKMDDNLVRVATTASSLETEQDSVLGLENTKTAQAREITSLKLRVKKLEKKGGSRTHKLKRIYKGRYGDEEMFDTGVLDDDEVLAEPEVTIKDEKANVVEDPSESITTTPTLTTTTTAATTVTAASTRPKAKGLVIHEEEKATTPTVSSKQPSQVKAQNKGKGIMVEEPVKMKKKDQISLDKELAFKLQAKEDEWNG
ncbi:hypothetical protein Tco_0859328 [Tanacetum coccineum]|uniref:Uncharacterized protein n=1 Tax=Tanacetum coccineum TaxID=301880 RepID=A0ABQ5BFC2_9ASTR